MSLGDAMKTLVIAIASFAVGFSAAAVTLPRARGDAGASVTKPAEPAPVQRPDGSIDETAVIAQAYEAAMRAWWDRMAEWDAATKDWDAGSGATRPPEPPKPPVAPTAPASTRAWTAPPQWVVSS